MMSSLRRCVVVVVAGLVAMVGVAVAAAPAEAAGPTVRVCAKWDGGRPYVGPVTVTTRQYWLGPQQTLNTAPNGCMIFKRVVPHRDYQAVVSQENGFCRTDPTTGLKQGSTTKISGTSRWKRTASQGQTSLGTFFVHRSHSFC
ncbi:hypothetical protein [Gordonia soli]|uniref:Secreted protein n=1 Tax=Gordonia soli NBRC 108243 TaxID=1223545 RepID=M0QH01_9ACTN|nr:hypothetical protein [Gordonia soli]GAC67591.1 hypothetical protein GS4_08_01760 [Gordonia soli NBRC 108243]